MTLFVPNRGVQDDLDPPVHHGWLLKGVAAPGIELLQEISLLLQTLVILPTSLFSVPGPPVYRQAVDQGVWSIFFYEFHCIVILDKKYQISF